MLAGITRAGVAEADEIRLDVLKATRAGRSNVRVIMMAARVGTRC